ncbi:hypothetical protein A5N15_04525 [Rothia kristinae]|uniref:ResB-like domain-containing protein n=1 Tax=Rothia kristinae TaxID=37923 RepID=A0A657IUW5_9MICC|nr:hypothetical protein A5N15_04525 [Rothia kristinae]
MYVLDTSSLHELNSMRNKNGIVLTEQNPKAELPEGKGSIELEGVSRYVGLDIHYDPGKPVVLVSFLLAFAGLVVSLFVARRRAWVTRVRPAWPTAPTPWSWSTGCWPAGRTRASARRRTG